MAEPATSESSPDTDRDFDPSADMMVHDFDDERTLDEEEALSGGESIGNELDSLQKEGDMPLEDLLKMYGYGDRGECSPVMESPAAELNDTRSSSEEEILSNQDLTLDKEEIARDLLQDAAGEEETSVNDLMDSVEMPSNTARLLRSAADSQVGSSDDDSEDVDYDPQKDEDWKKTISVGSSFQAVVPEGLSPYGDAPAYENEDRLLWDPLRLENADVESFLEGVQAQNQQTAQGVQALPIGGHVRDDEQALFLLLQCGHNTEEALRRRKMQAVPATDPMSLWSEEECRNFESGLRHYGKDFYLIQQNKVRTRSVGELVQFYYLWKKTDRHDMFANKNRLEKKKYALHPGITDYMDRFVDEQHDTSSSNTTQPALRTDRSSSPNIHSLLYGSPKHNHHLRTPTQEDIAAAMEMVQKVVESSAPITGLHDTTSSSSLPGLAQMDFVSTAPMDVESSVYPADVQASRMVAGHKRSASLCDAIDTHSKQAKLSGDVSQQTPVSPNLFTAPGGSADSDNASLPDAGATTVLSKNSTDSSLPCSGTHPVLVPPHSHQNHDDTENGDMCDHNVSKTMSSVISRKNLDESSYPQSLGKDASSPSVTLSQPIAQ